MKTTILLTTALIFASLNSVVAANFSDITASTNIEDHRDDYARAINQLKIGLEKHQATMNAIPTLSANGNPAGIAVFHSAAALRDALLLSNAGIDDPDLHYPLFECVVRDHTKYIVTDVSFDPPFSTILIVDGEHKGCRGVVRTAILK